MENLTVWSLLISAIFFLAVWMYSRIKKLRLIKAYNKDNPSPSVQKLYQNYDALTEERKKQKIADQVKLVVSICLSVLLTFSALYIILSQKYLDADTKWAYGIVGSMIGYWMKS